MRAAAARRAGHHLQRQRLRLARPRGAVIEQDGRALLNFSSNDYLGLAAHPELARSLQAAAGAAVGSGASALVSGYRDAHAELEAQLAEFLQRERVLVFTSGYLANLAVIASLVGRRDRVIMDRLCHASLIDAARLSRAGLSRYRHCDTAHLEERLAAGGGMQTLVVTDGVFSMDGDQAPLAAIADRAHRHSGWLMVDDAHGIGVMGPGGRGSVAQQGLGPEQVPVLVGTLGKAFGCAGAFVAGSEALIEHLVNEARTYIFTTAMPPPMAAAASTALALARREGWRRETLRERIAQFRAGADAAGLPLLPSETPIQPVMVGSSERAVQVAQALQERGLLVVAIRPPTVPANGARLRVTLSAAHEARHVTRLLDALQECLPRSR